MGMYFSNKNNTELNLQSIAINRLKWIKQILIISMYTLQNIMLSERKDNLQNDTYSLMLFSSALKT